MTQKEPNMTVRSVLCFNEHRNQVLWMQEESIENSPVETTF
jgi:hypothetical protein